MDIKQGELYQVKTDSFYTTGQKNPIKRPVQLEKGEIIEIRYPYEWHFRTADNEYFHATSEMIKSNCEYIGNIFPKVSFANTCNLKQILDLNLYEIKSGRAYSEFKQQDND